VGIATVALGWHYPSDVLGGYMVAGAWAAAVGGVVGLRSGGPWVASTRGFSVPIGVALGVVAMAAVVVWVGSPVNAASFVDDNTSFVVGSTLIFCAGAMVIAAVGTQLDGRRDL